MPEDPDGQKESEPLAETVTDRPVVDDALPPCDAVAADHTETAIAPTAAELVLNIRGSANALAQMGLAGARARLARLMPRARDTVTNGLEAAVAMGKEVTQKAGTAIKETAQDRETQELVLMGATAAAREVGLMMAGSLGGRIVERISEKLGDKLLHGRTAEGSESASPAKADGGEAEDKTG